MSPKDKRLANVLTAQQSTDDKDESDEEFVNVISLPGTPKMSRPPSSTNFTPRGESDRQAPSPLYIPLRRDPLKILPTDVSQRIFCRLEPIDLAKCALVSRKWGKSQTINYVWFQYYRKENFHDESLPSGKWTKRESKQNWRVLHLQSSHNVRLSTAMSGWPRGSGYSSPSRSGEQTPREIKEEKWRQEAEIASRSRKIEMRSMYKELGGRKSKAKTKLGSSGFRDRGGWDSGEVAW